jgi:uncharacterized protein YyaL (SSP411 family)
VGDLDANDTNQLLAVAQDGYRPFQVVAVGNPDLGSLAVPLLEDRSQIEGRATAYVCVEFVCQRPATDPEALRAQLDLR